MGTRGRTSAADLSLASSQDVVPLKQRPEPWPGLSKRECELWRSVVDAQAVDWFSPGDLPILQAYCRAIVLHERASREAEGAPMTVLGSKGGEVVNPILKVQDMAAKQIATLAVKLRLSQSAKWTEQKAATKHANSAAKKPWQS
jgi:P27 family predicted phage terminase small subunit